jgi:hypothetical protein
MPSHSAPKNDLTTQTTQAIIDNSSSQGEHLQKLFSDVYPNSPSFFDKSQGPRGLTVMHTVWFGSLQGEIGIE